jgi:hypothetical protein
MRIRVYLANVPAEPRPITGAILRLLAAGVALASAVPLWFGIAIASITTLAAAQRPDPSIPNGDPCCWHPDTWAQVAGGLAYAAGTVMACAALVYVAVALGRFAWSGTWQHLRRGCRLGLAVSYIGIWLLLVLELG